VGSVLALSILAVDPVAAQTSAPQEIPGDISYGYAVFLGTGMYKLDDRQLFVLRIPASWQIRDQKSARWVSSYCFLSL
jgi:hypothetical protein